jgi:hypothetical protein
MPKNSDIYTYTHTLAASPEYLYMNLWLELDNWTLNLAQFTVG